MKLTPLESSNLSGCHYDEKTQTLTVEFKGGARYSYGGVVKEDYDGLVGAESAGKFFHKRIRGNDKYKFTKHETK